MSSMILITDNSLNRTIKVEYPSSQDTQLFSSTLTPTVSLPLHSPHKTPTPKMIKSSLKNWKHK